MSAVASVALNDIYDLDCIESIYACTWVYECVWLYMWACIGIGVVYVLSPGSNSIIPFLKHM